MNETEIDPQVAHVLTLPTAEIVRGMSRRRAAEMRARHRSLKSWSSDDIQCACQLAVHHLCQTGRAAGVPRRYRTDMRWLREPARTYTPNVWRISVHKSC